VAKGRDGKHAWPVRAGRWLTRPFTAALVSGIADPPPPRARWRTPDAFQHLRHYLPISRIDIVVIGEIITALAIFAGTNSMLISANTDAPGTPIRDGELLLLASAAAAVPLLLRELWPLAAWRIALPSMFFVVSITEQVYETSGPANPYPIGAVLTYLLVLYSVGVRCARHISVGVWLLSVLGILILTPTPVVFLGAVMTAAALLFGYNVRVRRQAQRQVAEEEQRTEDERAARAVLEERSRIARELHDVVAHHMSVIAIQAEAAPIKAPADPEVLKAELAGIRGTALEALTELRRILGVLREGDEALETAPQPDLADIDQLLTSSRAAGLAVTMTTTGRPPPVPGGIGLATYRVLQESLSNALRHAPGAAVRVHLAYYDDRLDLRVENDRPPPTSPTRSIHRPAPPRSRGGQGLTGMRERIGAYGGTLTIGPTAAGGFAVAATIPYDNAPLAAAEHP
jgi:signal transduction histidine kinase